MNYSLLYLVTTSLFFTSFLANAETRYITDEFKVTLRTGASTSNSILSMLKSGESVKVIEEDAATKYSLIETSKGKQGYILSRFLDTQPSGREQYAKLQKTSSQQIETIKALRAELTAIKKDRGDISNSASKLQQQLDLTTDKYLQLQQDTKNTVEVIKKNKAQQKLIKQLETEKSQLLEENNSYKDSTAMDWFIRGSGVSLLAFLIGIIVTRIQWTKRDSWNDF